MTSRGLLRVGVAVLLALAAVSWSGAARADTTYIETTGSVAHTWTNYTNAGGTEGPEIGSHQPVQITCRREGFAVQDTNVWWYQIASSPWNNQYYVSADAFYNNGNTSGSLNGTPYYDPSVPICGTQAPDVPPSNPPDTTPAPSPTVTLSQGPSAPQGYRYAISLSGFSPNTSVSVNCYDSASPNGFYPFSMETDGSGAASTAHQCYTNDGPDHWVVADDVMSNHAQWASAPEPPATSHSASSPLSSPVPISSPSTDPVIPANLSANQCVAPGHVDALPYSGKLLPDALFQHYLFGHGTPVTIDWRYLNGDSGFKNMVESTGIGYRNKEPYTPYGDSTLFLSVGTFTVCRFAQDEYGMHDVYDFAPDKLENYPYLPLYALHKVGAADFDVYSRGRL